MCFIKSALFPAQFLFSVLPGGVCALQLSEKLSSKAKYEFISRARGPTLTPPRLPLGPGPTSLSAPLSSTGGGLKWPGPEGPTLPPRS